MPADAMPILSTFAEFALLLLITAAVGAVFVRLKQPVLIAYIVVGITVGGAGLGLVRAHEEIELLAQIGVAVLLFVVGLKLDLHHVRHIGPVALATGLGQLTFTILIGFLILLALDRGWVEALYIAVALTFSSTIIIVKLLSDKRELDSLHGRIAVGFLIVQDIAVVLAMMAMSTMRADGGAAAGDLQWEQVAFDLGWRIAAAAALLWVLMRYLLPPVVHWMAKSQELLLVFAIAWGVALAALGEWAGFSKEAGAFLAGFSLASTGYREAMSARLTGIRDFLLLFFFIHLGAKLDLSTLGAEIGPAILLSLFVLIGNPLIVMTIMGVMGYRRRTGFLAGLTVAQISEFSIIFMAMGVTLGHIGASALGLVTLIGLVTITMSTYMILYSHSLYERVAPWLGLFERKDPFRERASEAGAPAGERPEVLIVGIGRYGGRLLVQLRRAGVDAVGIDFDPEQVTALRSQGLPALFGDGEAVDYVESLPLSGVRWVITTLPQWDANRALLHALHAAGYRGRIALVRRDPAAPIVTGELPVDLELNPYDDAADHAARLFADRFRRDAGEPA